MAKAPGTADSQGAGGAVVKQGTDPCSGCAHRSRIAPHVSSTSHGGRPPCCKPEKVASELAGSGLIAPGPVRPAVRQARPQKDGTNHDKQRNRTPMISR
jgi:hypothetical protein